MDLPAAPDKNPAPPARQGAVCGEDLIYIATCSGGRNNQNQRGRSTEVYSRTTHHLKRCNLRFNFGRSNTLVGWQCHWRDLYESRVRSEAT
jgi:hypothetical protein